MPARIYTRSGDSGETGLFGGRRVSKTNARVEACGAVDELNAVVGLALSEGGMPEEIASLIIEIQHVLFTIGADLGTPYDTNLKHGSACVQRLGAEHTVHLEQVIDRYEARLPPLTQFILPGGSTSGARLHHARVVCRRAERACVALQEDAISPMNAEVLRYINRLSDLLFVAARLANSLLGAPDRVWNPGAGPAQA